MLFLSGRLQVVCAALLLLAAVRVGVAASTPTPGPAASVRAPLR